ncbi:MAG TPA: hypothetical protein VGS20_08365 [Candidatus Acidoferrales bacterium]|nr:hypothetical protein [Candidatus Acidoferrales bacterium]
MRWTRLWGLLAFAALGSFLAAGASAQQKTVEHRAAGPHEVNVELKHSTVAYIEGNHLVARLEDGSLEAIRIPAGTRFDVEGQQMTLSELKPGMIITETTIHTTKPMIVKTVEITDGKVFRVIGNRLIIQDKDNKLVHLTIPEWAKITIHGEDMELQDLRPGMTVTATFITEEPMTVVERQTKTHVRNPAKAPKTTVKEEALTQPETAPRHHAGTLTEHPTPAPEEPATELPATASPLPLAGLAGLLSLAASLVLRLSRKSS